MPNPDTGTTPEVCPTCHQPKDAPLTCLRSAEEADIPNGKYPVVRCPDPFHATPATPKPPCAVSGEA